MLVAKVEFKLTPGHNPSFYTLARAEAFTRDITGILVDKYGAHTHGRAEGDIDAVHEFIMYLQNMSASPITIVSTSTTNHRTDWEFRVMAYDD